MEGPNRDLSWVLMPALRWSGLLHVGPPRRDWCVPLADDALVLRREDWVRTPSWARRSISVPPWTRHRPSELQALLQGENAARGLVAWPPLAGIEDFLREVGWEVLPSCGELRECGGCSGATERCLVVVLLKVAADP